MYLCNHLGIIFWLGISLFVCIDSSRVGIGTFQVPGPGFFPFWSAIVLGSFAIIHAIGSNLKKKEAEEIRQDWKGIKWFKIILIVISLLFYTILMPWIGYLIATFLLLILLLSAVGRTRLWIRIMISMVTSITTYLLFSVGLGVQLPAGIFAF